MLTPPGPAGLVPPTSGRSRISPGGANSQEGAATYDFAKFSLKLHEKIEFGCPGGTPLVSPPPLNPPMPT